MCTVFILQDIVFHVVWILIWFITSVDWAVAFHRLDNLLKDYVNRLQISNCAGPDYVIEYDRNEILYVQAQIAVVSSIYTYTYRHPYRSEQLQVMF